MNNIKDSRFFKALLQQPVDKTPIWVMRQAGRYLPEYRKIRQDAGDFLTLCKTPSLASTVTLQPLQRFDLDAAIIFSDILTIPDAMGCGLYFAAGEGPKFEHPVRDASSVEKLPIVDGNDLQYVMRAIEETKKELKNKVPLIGFAGSPWTIACYMVEGGSSKNFNLIKKMLYNSPELLKQLLHKLALSTSAYLQAQISAGADVIMIFDTWGGILTPENYKEFSLYYMQQILNTLPNDVPTILFTKNGGAWLEAMADSRVNALGLDWTINIGNARARVGDKVALQGNLDPGVLTAGEDAIIAHVEKILRDYGKGSGHIFNLGHGITPDIPPEHVAILIEAVHDISQQYHTL